MCGSRLARQGRITLPVQSFTCTELTHEEKPELIFSGGSSPARPCTGRAGACRGRSGRHRALRPRARAVGSASWVPALPPVSCEGWLVTGFKRRRKYWWRTCLGGADRVPQRILHVCPIQEGNYPFHAIDHHSLQDQRFQSKLRPLTRTTKESEPLDSWLCMLGMLRIYGRQ